MPVDWLLGGAVLFWLVRSSSRRRCSATRWAGSLALTLVSSVVTYRRLRSHGLPDRFLRAFRIGRALRLATAASFLAVVALTLRG